MRLRRLNIGIDYDDVTVDTVPNLIKFINEFYERNLTIENFFSFDIHEVLGCGIEDAKNIWREYNKSSYFKKTPLIFGAKTGIEILTHEHNCFFITSRPEELKEHTIKEIELYFPGLFKESSVYFANHNSFFYNNKKSKAELCRQLNIDVLIDDCLEYALACDSNIKIILLDKPWNNNLLRFNVTKPPSNIVRAYSWQHIINIIDALARDYNGLTTQTSTSPPLNLL